MNKITKYNFIAASIFALLIIPAIKIDKAHLVSHGKVGAIFGVAAIFSLTTHKQKEQVISFPVSEFYKRVDSASRVLDYVGRSLSVDNATEVKNYYFGVVNRLVAMGKIDSIETKPIHK